MKTRFLAMLILIASFVGTASAQFVQFGVKGGLNVSNIHLSRATFDRSNRAGFFIGPTAKFKIPIVGVGADVSALYSQMDVRRTDNSATATLKTISVPVNVRFNFGASSLLGFYVAAGPQFDFNISPDNMWDTWKTKSTTTSANLGAGVTLLGHLELGVGYNFGLKKMVDSRDLAVRRNSFQLSATYFF